MTCAFFEQVEELAFGDLEGEARVAARTHVASCAVCRAELARLDEEMNLFAERRPMIAPPPALAPIAKVRRIRGETMLRTIHVVLGAAACAAALLVASNVGRLGASARQTETTSWREDLAIMSGGVIASRASEETLACTAPMSLSSRPAVETERSEVLACGDIAEPPACIANVTCSVLAP